MADLVLQHFGHLALDFAQLLTVELELFAGQCGDFFRSGEELLLGDWGDGFGSVSGEEDVQVAPHTQQQEEFDVGAAGRGDEFSQRDYHLMEDELSLAAVEVLLCQLGLLRRLNLLMFCDGRFYEFDGLLRFILGVIFTSFLFLQVGNYFLDVCQIDFD